MRNFFESKKLTGALVVLNVLLFFQKPKTTTHTADANFTGDYSDPNHPNCLRSIAVLAKDPTQAIVQGTDGNPGCPADGSGHVWKLQGAIQGDTISVDFSPKGGPKGLTGTRVSDGILWEDQNFWAAKDYFN